jgi:hypothetical protein
MPSNEFVEIYRSPTDQRVWETWIDGDYVIWMESLAPGNSGLTNIPHGDPNWTALRVTELSR